jgi:uncharacterized protein YndB with AHSA1/START domain
MQIELTQHVGAPPARVFALYTDHAGWTKWAGVKEVVLRQIGDPPPNGLGAIRVIRARGMAVEEEVTAFDPPNRMNYRLVAGAPVRDHEGVVRFEPDGAGTRVTWRVTFRPLIPGTGWLLRIALERGLRDVLSALAAHASRA